MYLSSFISLTPRFFRKITYLYPFFHHLHFVIMNKYIYAFLCVAIAGTMSAQTVQPAALPADSTESNVPEPVKNLWRPLFGEELSEARYNPEAWTYQDGILTAAADDAVWTTAEYENFEMDVDFKTDHGTNSGIIVYCSDTADWIPNSIEIQLADDHYPEWSEAKPYERCGAIYGHLAPSLEKTVKTPGEWNHIRVKCTGKYISVILNGKKVIGMDMSEWVSGVTNPDGTEIPAWLPAPLAKLPTKGYIGLQGKHGNAGIAFRNFKIRNARPRD